MIFKKTALKNFFHSMEERFVFPIGRRTWQILSLIALLILGAYILFFLYNATPTSRENVSVSKSEVIENKIDTAVATEEPSITCSQEDYNNSLDELKKDLPQSEWTKLGDSSEPYETYVIDENGNYVTSEDGTYLTQYIRNYNPNPYAIPNLLNALYYSKGLDSSSICQKIELLKVLHSLCILTEKKYLKETGFLKYIEFLMSFAITSNNIEDASELYNIIEESKPFIKDENTYAYFGEYINFLLRNMPNEGQLLAFKSLVAAHKEIKNANFNKKEYLDLADVIIDESLPEEELKNAIADFNDDIEFYDNNNLKKCLKRYLHLYSQKLIQAEEKLQLEKLKKETNRGESVKYGGYAFLAIVSIATILLLFSIQSLLKSHVKEKH